MSSSATRRAISPPIFYRPCPLTSTFECQSPLHLRLTTCPGNEPSMAMRLAMELEYAKKRAKCLRKFAGETMRTSPHRCRTPFHEDCLPGATSLRASDNNALSLARTSRRKATRTLGRVSPKKIDSTETELSTSAGTGRSTQSSVFPLGCEILPITRRRRQAKPVARPRARAITISCRVVPSPPNISKAFTPDSLVCLPVPGAARDKFLQSMISRRATCQTRKGVSQSGSTSFNRTMWTPPFKDSSERAWSYRTHHSVTRLFRTRPSSDLNKPELSSGGQHGGVESRFQSYKIFQSQTSDSSTRKLKDMLKKRAKQLVKRGSSRIMRGGDNMHEMEILPSPAANNVWNKACNQKEDLTPDYYASLRDLDYDTPLILTDSEDDTDFELEEFY